MEPAIEDRIRTLHRACLVTCLSMPFTLLVFVAVARWLELSGKRPMAIPAGFTALFATFLLLSLGASVASVFVRRALEQVPLRQVARLESGAAEWGEERATVAEAVLGGLYVGAQVSFIVAETGAVLGFVYFVMGGTWVYFLTLAGISVAAWIVNFPRISVWRERVESTNSVPAGVG